MTETSTKGVSEKFAARLSFEDVSLQYCAGDDDLIALSHLSFEVASGEPISVIGPSGCGKSTMLQIAAGLLQPSEGQVLVDSQPVSGPRRKTALILQDLGLMPWKTVRKNASMGLEMRRTPKAETRRRTDGALREVGLEAFADAYPKELSGGMKQRLAIARSLALDFDLLLMDEPLSALDALLRESLQNTLLQLWQTRNHAQVLVTHSIEEAVYLGRRIIVLAPRPGHIIGCIDNPNMGKESYRGCHEFNECCRRVRSLLYSGSNNPTQTIAPAETMKRNLAIASEAKAGAR